MLAADHAYQISLAGDRFGEWLSRILDKFQGLAKVDAWCAAGCALAVLLAWPAVKFVGGLLFSAIAAVPVTHVETFGCAARALTCLH